MLKYFDQIILSILGKDLSSKQVANVKQQKTRGDPKTKFLRLYLSADRRPPIIF